MNDINPCTICGEEECICEYCPNCTLSDVPIETLDGKECPNCGQLMPNDPDEPSGYEDNIYFQKTETEAIMHSPWFE